MSVREQEPVAPLPGRIVRSIAHRVKIGDRKNVGDVECLCDITLTLDLAHAKRVAADVVGSLRERDHVS